MTAALRTALALRRIGWFPLAAAVPLLAAAWLHFGAIEAEEIEAARLQAEIDAVGKEPAAPPVALQLTTRLDEFRAVLLERSALPTVAQSFATEAAKAGLAIELADYQLSPWPDSDFLAYRATLPVHGSYGSIRQFIDGCLAASPTTALTEVDFKRETVGATSIEARLEFVVFVKAGPES